MRLRSRKFKYNPQQYRNVRLYSLVYASKASVVAVIFLFLSFLVQPIHQAFANEEASENTEVAETVLPTEVEEQLPKAKVVPAEEITETAPPVVVKKVADAPSENNEPKTIVPVKKSTPDSSEPPTKPQPKSNVAPTAETVTDVKPATSTDSAPKGNTETELVTSSSTITSEAGPTERTASSSTASSSSSGAGTSTSTGSTNDTGSTGGGSGSDDTTESHDTEEPEVDIDTEDVTNDGSDLVENSTSTADDLIDNERIQNGVNSLVDEVVNEVVTLTRQLVTEENYYQFSRQSCAPVGDGTFHCSMNSGISIDPDSAVYASKDADGDMEIYMKASGGESKQLSDNDLDDTAPYLDLASKRVVWQRLIDGRYQVISYDLVERKETQLTFSKHNNMEPKASEEGIVWQAWDGNDWEIIFFDGKFTDQITNNEIQDVTPVVEDGYILWSVLGGKESEARVYEIKSGEILTIAGHEGGAVSNPRFVLVYDTKFDNGDVITRGFDPETGLSAPITAKPGPEPIDIPEPDPVGEIRALIQNKSAQKEQVVVSDADSSAEGELNLASSTATSSGTLNINPIDIDQDSPTSTTTDNFIELDEFDLVITKTASSAPTKMNVELIDVPSTSDTQYISTSTQQ